MYIITSIVAFMSVYQFVEILRSQTTGFLFGSVLYGQVFGSVRLPSLYGECAIGLGPVGEFLVMIIISVNSNVAHRHAN